MGIVQASIKFKESLEDVKYQIESLKDPIKEIYDDEARGYIKCIYDQLIEAEKANYESGLELLEAIDEVLGK